MLPIRFDASMGSVWVQKSGPNSLAELLECGADVADIGNPRGGFARSWEIDPATGKHVLVHVAQEAPDAISTTVTTHLGSIRSIMDEIICPGGLFLVLQNCRKGVWGDYQTVVLGENMRLSDDSLSNLAMGMSDSVDLAEHAWEMELDARKTLYPLKTMPLTTTELYQGSKIVFYNQLGCPPCGDGTDICDQGIIVCDGFAALTANVLYTSDAGQTWAAAAADPFAAAENISSAAVIPIAGGGYRWLVSCGTTAPAGSARVARSDNLGVTWTVVNLSATVAEFVPGSNGLFAFNDRNIWAVTDLGNGFLSEDGGLTWTDKGPTTALALHCVTFKSPMVGWIGGATNALFKTSDGGQTWSTVAGPAAEAANTVLAISIIDENRAWLAYSSGNIYYTNNGGTTWTERLIDGWVGAAVTRVNDIQFMDEYIGFALYYHATRIGGLIRTYDGGATWEKYATSVFDVTAPLYGWRSLAICDENRVYAAGGLQNALSSIVKFEA